MSRRPSLPGAAELFRATGGAAPADAPVVRDAERVRQRLRPAGGDGDRADGAHSPGVAAAAVEHTASVTPLASSAVADPPAASGSAIGRPAGLAWSEAAAPAAKAAGAPGPAPAPQAPPTRHGPADGGPRAAGIDDDPGTRRPRTNGVRQTRRQRMRTVGERRPSGRENHEEKITVYCSAEELLDLETARLTLRGEHGLVVDRGRIVREAVAIILADLEAKGEDSIIVRRLHGS